MAPTPPTTEEEGPSEEPAAPGAPLETEEPSEGPADRSNQEMIEELTDVSKPLVLDEGVSEEASSEEKTEELPEELEPTHTADGRKYATAVNSAHPTTPKRTARKKAPKKKAAKKKGKRR